MRNFEINFSKLVNPHAWWHYIILFRASNLIENGRYSDAKECLKNLLKEGSASEYHYYLLGKIYLEEKNYVTAKKCFETSLEYNPLNNIYKANTYFYLGLTHYESGNFQNAILNFQKAIDIKEKIKFSRDAVISIPHLYCYLGRTYSKLGKREQALEAFNRGLSYEPNNEALQRELTLHGI